MPEIISKLFHRFILQLTNIIRRVRCRRNNFEIIFSGWNDFNSVSKPGCVWSKHWNDFEIISVFYFTCNQLRWLHMEENTTVVYDSLLARSISYHLAKFGWVPFADFRVRRLVMKQNLWKVGKNSGPIFQRLWIKVMKFRDFVWDSLYFLTPIPNCLRHV